MEDYFRAVTLGAFTWKDRERIALLFSHVRKLGGGWLLLHFLLLTVCLDFPVTLIMTRLEPYQLYGRLYGENFLSALPEQARGIFAESQNGEAVNVFNVFMIENGYGRNTLLPLLGLMFGLVLIIQAVFYLAAAFCLGLSRLNASALSFRDRVGLAVFSSTLPVLAASLFALFLPTVHFIVFYFIVIFIIFQRSKLCPNG
jgi:hypothetical protein